MTSVIELKKNMLDARDQRMIKEKQLMKHHGTTLIAYSLNLPGGIPITDTVKKLHAYGMNQLMDSIKPYEHLIEHVELCEDAIGPIGYICLDLSWKKTKFLAIELEEGDMYGRLFDIDVIQRSGAHVSRSDLNQSSRLCFICNEAATVCRRSGAHTPDELQTYVGQMLEHFEKIMKMRYQRLS